MINLSWITDNLAISGAILEQDLPSLKQNGIDLIVDLRSEYSDNKEVIEELGMQFLHLDIDDRYSPSFEQLEEIINFVEPFLNKDKKVLIHCQNGCGRAPLVAVAILAMRRFTIADAVGLVQDKNPLTGFTPDQEKFIYVELERFLKSIKK